MNIFHRNKNPTQTPAAIWLQGSDGVNFGYHALLDEQDVMTCIDWMAGLIASAPIRLMRNTADGDVRVHDELSRRLDIDPMPGTGNRFLLLSWIVRTLLGRGNGNAFVLPETAGNTVTGFLPMPGATVIPESDGWYLVQWEGAIFEPNEVLHFRLWPDPNRPWLGSGIRVQAENLAKSLMASAQLKANLSSPDYKPPMAVFVNSDSDLSDESKRDAFRRKYLEDSRDGKPWILPADLVKMEQVKPLTLTDLAIRDNVELDKGAVCSLIGVPGYVLGVGKFSEREYNNIIRTRVIPIVQTIEQECTSKLLRYRPTDFWRVDRRHLYDYDIKTTAEIDCMLADLGYLNGDEVRVDLHRDPAGLKERVRLENYIPADMAGNQKKLTGQPEKEEI